MPKAKRPRPTERRTLSHQLREIIRARGLTAYRLGQLADVDPAVISRWLAGARDIRLETADRIAATLGLRLVEPARPRRAARADAPTDQLRDSWDLDEPSPGLPPATP